MSVQQGSFVTLLEQVEGATILADEFLRPLLVNAGVPATFVQAIEENKSLEASPLLIQQMRAAGVNRQTRLIAVGGGIVQDISAFIASVYMRGIEWTYVPTTVLSMVDSCIGGKSSINVGPYKNLVGTFHPPVQITIDPALITTLPQADRASGLIEAAKICFCRGEDAFNEYLSFQPSASMPLADLEGVINISLLSKKWFIEIDEFDKKERLLLNFGHTFGHAIEGATHFGIPHGIAVGLGIACALEFGEMAGTEYSATPAVRYLRDHIANLVSSCPDVGERLQAMSLQDVLDRFRSDKKHGKDFYTLILVSEKGAVELRRLPKDNQTIARVQQAFERVIGKF
ncbi:3-dehydroquinate synthase [Terriglobus albidus]|uniref:3-dehydroquinate synthase n=1 Tax=Terriglobus albidus TaxID=1592106 RepID=UPI001FE3BDB5|nr:3-dehydroquinate synthase family protein [Terriglobus albidus]